MDRMTIMANIEARNAADAVHNLASQEVRSHTGDAALRFWRRMLVNVCAVLPPQYHPQRLVETVDPPLTDTEARCFGRTTIPFGQHKGKRVDEVPMDYLLWLDDQPDFRRMLRRYLASDRIHGEEPGGGDEGDN